MINTCPCCNGEGIISCGFEDHGENFTLCLECVGSGLSDRPPCFLCGNTQLVTCFDCSGTGEQCDYGGSYACEMTTTCMSCNGMGKTECPCIQS